MKEAVTYRRGQQSIAATWPVSVPRLPSRFSRGRKISTRFAPAAMMWGPTAQASDICQGSFMSKLLASGSSALLVIDLQARLMPALADPEEVLERSRLVLHAARLLSVPILATEQYPKGLGPLVPEIAEMVPLDAVVSKIAFSALRDPEPADRIARLDREQLVVMGAETHVCVLQTVLDLLASGRKVTVVADAVGSRRLRDKEVGIARMERAGAEIVTADMVVFEWLERAGTPAFKELAPLLRR